jgi:thiol-disulfide isomerase/thioredoxin
VIWVDDQVAKGGAVAVASRAGNLILLRAPQLGGGVLLRPAKKTVARIEPGKIVEELDQTFAVGNDPEPEVVGTFEVGDQGISFALGDHRVELRQGPNKIGLHAGEELVASNVGYAFRARAYVPDSSVVDELRGVGESLKVRVFFGSWCPYCSNRIPRLLRVARDLGSDDIQFEYFGLPSPFRDDPEAKKFDIKGVPTAVVLRGDEELGRIKGQGWNAPESSLRDLLRTAGLLDV